jgi:hypothetical membrane protein
VASSALFIAAFTAAGLLRPGYSAMDQAISDLGVGPLAWLLNVPLVLLGCLLAAMAVGFARALPPGAGLGWRWACGVLLASTGLGYVTAGIFPETNPIHWVVGQPLFAIGSVFGILVAGLQFLRDGRSRGNGVYSLLTSASALVLIILMNLTLNPGSQLAALRVGGLTERVAFVVVLAWYGAIGWQLFRSRSGIQ